MDKGFFLIVGPLEDYEAAKNAKEDIEFVLDWPEEIPVHIEPTALEIEEWWRAEVED